MDQAAHVVGEVFQPDPRPRPYQPDAAHQRPAHVVALVIEFFRMFHLRVPYILPLACLAVIFPASADERPAPGTEFQDCMACPVMKVVPGGEFVQGSPPSSAGHFHSEGVIRTVTIARPYAAGKYEVTFDQWDACIAAGRCDAVDDGDWGRGRYPVINVSWKQAVVYTDWISELTGKQYRLLSESEWEYVARAGLPRFRFFGLAPEQLCRVANVYDLRSKAEYDFEWEHVLCDDGFAGLAPVGSLTPNAFGLYDMQGNVAELFPNDEAK